MSFLKLSKEKKGKKARYESNVELMISRKAFAHKRLLPLFLFVLSIKIICMYIYIDAHEKKGKKEWSLPK